MRVAGIENYLRPPVSFGYDGPLANERKIAQESDRQKAEIGRATKLLAELRNKVLG